MLRILFFISTFLFASLYFGGAWAGHQAGGQISAERIDSLEYHVKLELLFDPTDPTYSPNINNRTIYVRGVHNTYLSNVGIYTLNSTSIDTVTFTNACLPGTAIYISRVYEGNIVLPSYALNISNGVLLDYSSCCVSLFANSWLPGTFEGVMLHIKTLSGFSGSNQTSPFTVPSRPVGFCRNQFNSYNFPAIEPDGDSIAFELYPYRNTLGGGQTIVSGALTTNSVPSNPIISIDPISGEFFGQPLNQGIYGFGQKVQEFRNGIMITEGYRFFPLISRNCISVNSSASTSFLESTGFSNCIGSGDTIGVFSGSSSFPFSTVVDDPQNPISWHVESNNVPVGDIQLGWNSFTGNGPGDTILNIVTINLSNSHQTDTFKIITTDTICPNQFYDTLVLKIWFFNSSNAGIGGVHQFPLFSQNSIDLFPLLGGSPLNNGAWLDLDGSGLISNGILDASMVNNPAVYRVGYRQQEPNYPADTAILELRFFDPNGLSNARKDELGIYPNPSSGQIHFQVPGNEAISRIQVFDHSGKFMREFEEPEGYSLDLMGLPSGIYLIRVLGLEWYHGKLLKE